MEGSNLQQLPQGYLGKMLVYKSGKIKMKLGDIIFDVSVHLSHLFEISKIFLHIFYAQFQPLQVNPGVESRMLQRAVALNTRDKHCCLLGEIENRHVIVTPNVDSLLNDK
jgi:DNA-directed RNA polymerase III subunit RPC4